MTEEKNNEILIQDKEEVVSAEIPEITIRNLIHVIRGKQVM